MRKGRGGQRLLIVVTEETRSIIPASIFVSKYKIEIEIEIEKHET